jgi:hypothetical protein
MSNAGMTALSQELLGSRTTVKSLMTHAAATRTKVFDSWRNRRRGLVPWTTALDGHESEAHLAMHIPKTGTSVANIRHSDVTRLHAVPRLPGRAARAPRTNTGRPCCSVSQAQTGVV